MPDSQTDLTGQQLRTGKTPTGLGRQAGRLARAVNQLPTPEHHRGQVPNRFSIQQGGLESKPVRRRSAQGLYLPSREVASLQHPPGVCSDTLAVRTSGTCT